MLFKSSLCLPAALLAAGGLALNTDDQVNADIDYGTFEDPSAFVRPRFRYWIPDASVDLDTVRNDFKIAKDVGAGGLELLGYYLYGNYPSQVAEGGPVPVDWGVYDWGLDAWKNLTDVALRATKDLGMIMDFALGPNQGAGVPAAPDDEGVMWTLWPFNVSVPIGGTFDDVLPGWGKGRFVSASTGLVTATEFANYSASPAWIGPVYYNGSRNTLSASSLEDVTGKVDSQGRLNLSFPSDVEGVEYQVFAFYESHSSYLEQASPLDLNTTVPQSPVENFVQNGSRVVDHFSAAGAKLITDFWDQYLLDEDTRQLFKDVGNYAWEDSIEIGAGTLLWWTPNLLETFKASTGYDLNKYLPLVYSYNTEANGPLASPDRYYTNEDDEGQSHINDYWGALTLLNRVYLETLTNWSIDALESQFSAQVAYNLPMDMLANVPSVNGPECESLGFNHVIDAYRQFAGPANLAGKRIMSSELGAQREEVYKQTMPELIWDVKRSVIGSINQFVYHGYPYTGSYPNTTWPGYSTFTYRFSNMHGPRQPTWKYFDDFMNWTARVQYVAQSGVPKIDLVFWSKKNDYYEVDSQYLPNDLQDAGFSYEYLSPDNFHLPEAYVANGTFAPERQAFKALILRANDTLTVPGVQRLVEYAHQGLPIVFSGGVPQNLTGYNTTGTEYVRSTLATMTGLENVHIVPYDNLAASLTALGITPRTKVASDRTWYTYWREDKNASTTYVFVYNDAWDSELGEGLSTGSITFEATGVPYQCDAWTGAIDPIAAYQQSQSATTIPLTLAGNQSTIIAFRHNETRDASSHVIATPPETFGASLSDSGVWSIKAGNTSQPLLLSNGTALSLPIPAPPAQLTNWTLIVEAWNPPADLEADQTKPALANSTYNITSLQPWNAISDDLRNVSGRGFYSTSFTWPPANGRADGAVLHLGPIVNTARAWVNGHQVPPFDPTNATADIGSFLVNGTNEVEIVVATTLSNVLRTIWRDVKSSGTLWLGPEPKEQEYGLVWNVSVVPYRSTAIALV
ncbi:hypothetical protein M409DRAFT_50088 [Zasmidium cellare ATCC 36951]|uniref:Glycoside hydrolase family 2 protein n=1 Tax=Zasmidium cellare ATCC 36951 TaxID=1080233 RepID=A0A6A6D1U2_ZASCE|nr:uncharacterized protein M409DRAFT_50088 [Zasmidium cellare ATCC 36951]KAF2172380.1 hypothetical protein M409DRAFT_50088 [Zasmidium cellare ATCC 36951]